MANFFSLMTLPFLACLILTGMHAYLGMHVLERRILFVDLALAQLAALGSVAAMALGFDVETQISGFFPLGVTFLGAAFFSFARGQEDKIPHEAVIGMTYAVSAALAVLLLNQTAEGDEHIRHMLVGNVLLVEAGEVVWMAVLYGILGVFFLFAHQRFLLLSSGQPRAMSQGFSIRKWDFFFYAAFGCVVTSSVKIAGVLLVFSFLVIPAITSLLFCRSFRARLFLAWGVGILASFTGMSVSFVWDVPTGAAVVCSLGGVFLLASLIRSFLRCRGSKHGFVT